MELSDYVRALSRRWRLVTALTVLGILVAIAVTVLTPRVYSAQAKLFVGTSSNDTSAQGQYAASEFTLARMSSYVQLNASGRVLNPVITSLGLHESERTLAEHVSLSSPTETVTLDVSVTSSSARSASSITNAVAKQLSLVIEDLERHDSRTGANPVVVTVTETAHPDSTPISPRPALDLALGLLSGLVVGVLVALARDQLDRSVRSGAEAVRVSALPALGVLPLSRPLRRRGPIPLPPPVLDGVRKLRANLSLTAADSPAVAVVSPGRGDGRTTVAVALAIAAAQGGHRVCLVDADLREPAIANRLKLTFEAGLAEVLDGSSGLDEALVGTLVEAGETVTALCARPVDDGTDVAALLDGPDFERVLDELAERFDLVVIDAPPVDPRSESLLVARRVPTTLVVVRPGTTDRDGLCNAVATLGATGARVVGMVANAISPRNLRVGPGPSMAALAPDAAAGAGARRPGFVPPDGPELLAATLPRPTTGRPGHARALRHHIDRPDEFGAGSTT